MRFVKAHEYFAICDALEGAYYPSAILSDIEIAQLQIVAYAFRLNEPEDVRNIGEATDIVDGLRQKAEDDSDFRNKP
jgi:putative N-acetylmannosamine-6-phosphate epimerase